jgi:hypothetical protein
VTPIHTRIRHSCRTSLSDSHIATIMPVAYKGHKKLVAGEFSPLILIPKAIIKFILYYSDLVCLKNGKDCH